MIHVFNLMYIAPCIYDLKIRSTFTPMFNYDICVRLWLNHLKP